MGLAGTVHDRFETFAAKHAIAFQKFVDRGPCFPLWVPREIPKDAEYADFMSKLEIPEVNGDPSLMLYVEHYP
jgi:hypothetical protein